MENEDLNVKIDNLRQNLVNNLYFLIVALMSIVYIFYGLLNLDTTGKTVIEIIRDGAINLVFGYTIGVLLANQGYGDGGRLQVLEKCRERHQQKKAEINSYSDRLDEFCRYENDKEIKEYRLSVLSTVGIKYDDFMAGKYDELFTNKQARKQYSKSQLRAIHKAYNPKITKLSSSDLLVGESIDYRGKNDLGESENTYKKRRNTRAIGSRLIYAILFGYFGVNFLDGFNWANVIWTSIQAATFLASGFGRYFDAFQFMRVNMVARYDKQLSILDKFSIWNENNPRKAEE